MKCQHKPNKQTYLEIAPPPTDPSIDPSIYAIELEIGQAVQWQWTELSEGKRVVTGYKIIEQGRTEGEASSLSS